MSGIALGFVVIFLVIVTLLEDQIIGYGVTRVVSKVTGAPVHIDRVSVNLLRSSVHISGFKMYNPPGFPEGPLISCPEITGIYDRADLFKRKIHIPIMAITVESFVLVKNEKGELNVDSLKFVQHPSPPRAADRRTQIDLLTLNIGKIVYKDYTAGPKPSERAYVVNKTRTYKNIPTAQQLIALVLEEPMKLALIKQAKIYGVVMFTGVAALPISVIAVFVGKDSVQQIVDAGFSRVYEVGREVMAKMGTITSEDAADGVIKANMHRAKVTIKLEKRDGNRTQITISARKYLIPRHEIAGGVLYEMLEKL